MNLFSRMISKRKKKILITGCSGYLGTVLLRQMARDHVKWHVFGIDIKPPAIRSKLKNFTFRKLNLLADDLGNYIRSLKPDVVIHLASIVEPPKGMKRDTIRKIEVNGTLKLLELSLQAGSEQFIVTSSGAAYGYYPDNERPLTENSPVRGNPEFAYSDHKRRIEEILKRYRMTNPEQKQLIFRSGTILGRGTDNQITALFNRKRLPAVSGSDSPFVFIWDEDVAGAIIHGIKEKAGGIYNLAGDGTMTIHEIAERLNRKVISLPAWLMKLILAVLKPLKLTRYGPEQVDFLRYRPVLSNEKLKNELGYIPQKTTRETFEYFLEHRRD